MAVTKTGTCFPWRGFRAVAPAHSGTSQIAVACPEARAQRSKMHTLTLLCMIYLHRGQTGSAKPPCCYHTGQQEIQVYEQSCISRSADTYWDSHGSPSGRIHWSWDKSMTTYTFAREGWKLGKTPHLEQGFQRQHKITPSLAVASVRHQAENPA